VVGLRTYHNPLVEFWEYSKYKNRSVFVILSAAGNLEEKALPRNQLMNDTDVIARQVA